MKRITREMEIRDSLAEDLDKAVVWVNKQFVSGLRSPVKVRINGHVIYADIRFATAPYIKRYNNKLKEHNSTDFLSEDEPFITLSEYYRERLQVTTNVIIRVRITSASFLYGSWQVSRTHPDCVVRFSSILGLLGFILGIISLLLGILS